MSYICWIPWFQIPEERPGEWGPHPHFHSDVYQTPVWYQALVIVDTMGNRQIWLMLSLSLQCSQKKLFSVSWVKNKGHNLKSSHLWNKNNRKATLSLWRKLSKPFLSNSRCSHISGFSHQWFLVCRSGKHQDCLPWCIQIPIQNPSATWTHYNYMPLGERDRYVF